MPFKLGKTLCYALLLWIIGFVWGVFVFMVPMLKNVTSVPYVSKYPAVSVPLLVTYPILMFFIAGRLLKEISAKPQNGLEFGVAVLLVNLALDSLVYIILLNSLDYFTYLSIWLAYALFLTVPWLTGKWLQGKAID